MYKFTFICLAFFCVLKVNAQGKYLIIDRKMKAPAEWSDNFTIEQGNKGYFPIEKEKIDSILTKFTELKQRLSGNGRENYDEFIWKIGNTRFDGKVVKWHYGDRFNIAISTDVGNGYSPSFYIANSTRKNQVSANYIGRLIEYIKKAK